MRRLKHIPHVVHVEVVRPHTLQLRFDDGLARTLEFIPRRQGPMLLPLDDPEFFARVTVEHGTIAWPHGLDMDPVVLHGDREPVGGTLFREVSTVTGPQTLAR